MARRYRRLRRPCRPSVAPYYVSPSLLLSSPDRTESFDLSLGESVLPLLPNLFLREDVRATIQLLGAEGNLLSLSLSSDVDFFSLRHRRFSRFRAQIRTFLPIDLDEGTIGGLPLPKEGIDLASVSVALLSYYEPLGRSFCPLRETGTAELGLVQGEDYRRLKERVDVLSANVLPEAARRKGPLSSASSLERKKKGRDPKKKG